MGTAAAWASSCWLPGQFPTQPPFVSAITGECCCWELKAANQPATLITAFAPFQENHRLRLNSNGDTQLVQLERRIFATGSVNQFTFRTLEVNATGENKGESEDFASVWRQ